MEKKKDLKGTDEGTLLKARKLCEERAFKKRGKKETSGATKRRGRKSKGLQPITGHAMLDSQRGGAD